jgi:AcrR family transcriptional regulator
LEKELRALREQNEGITPPVELHPRRNPLQDRAKQTVEKIFMATAELLEEEGVENLTTDRVAERSGVNISTLYHYYPNKLALLYALAQHFADQQQEQLDTIYHHRNESGWRDIVDKVVDTTLQFNRNVKGALAVSRAMQSHAMLREIDYERDSQQSKFVATILAELGIKGSHRELQIRALVLIQMAGSAIDKALLWYPENADAAIKEVKIMLKQYIAYYLEQSTPARNKKNPNSR